MFCGMGFASLKARKKVDMNPDEVINIYKDKLGRPPSLEAVEKGRKETLKKVFKAKVLADLADRIVSAYKILADVARGRRKLPPSQVALLAGGLAYLALPFDLVCDVIPVAGFVDDGIVLSWIFSRCAALFSDGGRDAR